jgi:endo-1,4-beta-D-glucanase Y
LCYNDTEHEIQNRIEASKNGGEDSSIDPIIVAGLQKMLDEHNVLAKTLRMAQDKFKEDDYHEYTLKLVGKISGTHNLPYSSEVAALVV